MSEATERLLFVPDRVVPTRDELPAGEPDRPSAKGGMRCGLGETDGEVKGFGERENGRTRKYRSLNASAHASALPEPNYQHPRLTGRTGVDDGCILVSSLWKRCDEPTYLYEPIYARLLRPTPKTRPQTVLWHAQTDCADPLPRSLSTPTPAAPLLVLARRRIATAPPPSRDARVMVLERVYCSVSS